MRSASLSLSVGALHDCDRFLLCRRQRLCCRSCEGGSHISQSQQYHIVPDLQGQLLQRGTRPPCSDGQRTRSGRLAMLARLRRTREMSANTASFGTTMLFKRTMSLGDTMLRTHVYIMYTYTYWRRCYAKQLRAPAHVCRYSWARALDMFRRRVRCGRNTNRGCRLGEDWRRKVSVQPRIPHGWLGKQYTRLGLKGALHLGSCTTCKCTQTAECQKDAKDDIIAVWPFRTNSAAMPCLLMPCLQTPTLHPFQPALLQECETAWLRTCGPCLVACFSVCAGFKHPGVVRQPA